MRLDLRITHHQLGKHRVAIEEEVERCHVVIDYNAKVINEKKEVLGTLIAYTTPNKELVVFALNNYSLTNAGTKIDGVGTLLMKELKRLGEKISVEAITLNSTSRAVAFYWSDGFIFDPNVIRDQKIYQEMTQRMQELFKTKVPGKHIETEEEFKAFAKRLDMHLIPMCLPNLKA